jgi:hypothetical protein
MRVPISPRRRRAARSRSWTGAWISSTNRPCTRTLWVAPAEADVYLLAHPAGYARYLADYHGTLFGEENAPGETSIYTYDF